MIRVLSRNPLTPTPTGGVGFPSATSTGLTGVGVTAAQLTVKAGASVKTSTVFDLCDFTGPVNCYPGAATLKITRSRITLSDIYGVDGMYAGGSCALDIEDCDIICPTTHDCAALLDLAPGSTVKRCRFSGGKQHLTGSFSGALIQGNYGDGIQNFTGSEHCENIYVGGPCATQGQIVGNTWLNSLDQTAAIFLDSKGGPLSNLLIQGNLLAGGTFVVYGGAQETQPSNIAIVGNTFSKRYWPLGGDSGSYTAVSTVNGCQFSGNVWEDGTPV